MRLGILECDHVAPEWLQVAGDYADMHETLFSSHDFEFARYDVVAGDLPDRPDECDAWITTGSKHSVYDGHSWIDRLGDFIREVHQSRVPFVGVCFGHQMIAHALGGTVERAANGWGVGVQTVQVPEPPGWLGETAYRIPHSHQDQITRLPSEAVVLGSNDHCQVGLMAVADTIVGIQGHPEFPAEYAATLLGVRRGWLIPDEVAEAGLATFNDQVDDELVAAALARFMRRTAGRP